MSVSEALKSISENGFSDAYVAKAVGVSSVSIFNYRTGKRTPNYDIGAKIIELKSIIDSFVDTVNSFSKK